MNRDVKKPLLRKLAVLAGTTMMAVTPVSAWAATVLVNSFVGTSDRNTRALGIGLQPPDVNGAVGTTQFAQLQNGSFAVYNKFTGALLAPRITDSAFFLANGGTRTGGDVRILFDAPSSRWIAIGFASINSRIQIAVSNTADALGTWRTTSFQGVPVGGTADYPTLALSGNTVTIGTNNFTPGFAGVTLNTINRSDLFGAGAPTTASLRQFNTPFPGPGNDGFAVQGVNRAPGVGSGTDVVAASLLTNELVTYNITAAGVKGTTRLLAGGDYLNNRPARQPDLGNTGNARVVDTLDDRVSSSVYQVNGKIYAVHTVTPLGQDHTVIRISVIDAATKALLSETDITGPDNSFDYYQGSLAVNNHNQLVVGFVRSGDRTHPIDGRISILAKSFNTNANGTLTATSGELLIKQSPVDSYHLGSPFGSPAAGRQRFGDYSSVTLDPTNDQRFYVINEFADFFNNAAGGNPAGSGFARFGTFVGIIGVSAIPEPANWAMMIAGFGLVGGAMRRRKTIVKFAIA